MKKLVLALCCVAALVSCKKTAGPQGPQGPQGAAGPQGPAGNNGGGGTGTITGKVKQYNQYGVEYTSGLNNTTVSIDGSTVTALTDASGNYTLSNLSAGIYDISYQKSGNGLSKQQQIVFPGTGTLYMNGSLYDVPTFTLFGGYVKDTVLSGTHTIKVNLNFVSDSKKRGVMIVFGTSPAVDLGNSGSFIATTALNLNSATTFYSTNFSYSNVLVNNVASGATVYVKVYPVSSFSSQYYDYLLGREVYTSYGTPLPTTFTLTMP